MELRYTIIQAEFKHNCLYGLTDVLNLPQAGQNFQALDRMQFLQGNGKEIEGRKLSGNRTAIGIENGTYHSDSTGAVGSI